MVETVYSAEPEWQIINWREADAEILNHKLALVKQPLSNISNYYSRIIT